MAESRLPLYKKSLLGAVASVALFVAFFSALALKDPRAALDTTRQIIDAWIPLVSMAGTLLWIRMSRKPSYLRLWEGIIATGFISLLLSTSAAITIYFYCTVYPAGLEAHKVYLITEYLPKIKAMTESLDPGSYDKLVEVNKNLTALEMAYSELSRKFLICIVLSVVLSLSFRKQEILITQLKN